MSERDPARRLAELEALVGQTVAGKYLVTRLLGRGGMGAVYEAENVGIGKRVALKLVDRELAQDETIAGRFAREARAASSIESEHIVQVFDAGSDDGRPFIVMELLRGEDLGTRLRRQGRIPLDEALHVVAQTLSGLARAHAAGIVHRDLKPDNVFLQPRGADASFVKIVDFGISKIERARSGTAPLVLTHKGHVMGTPLYMSPEQAQAFEDLDGRSDLYSVGAMLFECITGRPPHTGASFEQVLIAICTSDAPDVRAIVPSVPEGVAELVACALARDRRARFQSAAQMLAALHEVAPAEKTRVPLEESDALLLASTPAPSAGPPTAVTWAQGGTREAGSAPPSKAPSKMTLPLTALVATLMGVGVTTWIVTEMRDRHPPAAAQDDALPAGTASGAPAASAITMASSVAVGMATAPRASASSVAASAPSAPAHHAAKPVITPNVVSATNAASGANGSSGANGKSAGPKSNAPSSQGGALKPLPSPAADLDIQRDLP